MMRFCTNCGRLAPSGAARCPQCGTPLPPQTPPQTQTPPPAAPAAQPVYTRASAQEANAAPLSTVSCLCTLIAACVPVLGLVALLVWSIGTRRTPPARRNLARALLILRLALAVLIALLAVLLALVSTVVFYSVYTPQPYYW